MSERILVAGAGRSGISASKMILQLGGSVLLYDSSPDLDVEKLKENFENTRQILFKTGELARTDLNDVSICVISPGIDPEKAPFVRTLDMAGIPIWSEIQLAYQMEKGRLVAITGTNGKTTTTSLTGEIMAAAFPKAFTVGNIGLPYTETALKTDEASVTVLETSSFQLETITDFRPHVSAILNLTPDHLDRHHTFENYVSVKKCIAMNQTEEDFCVLNHDDPVLREFGRSPELKARPVFFSGSEELEEGFFLREGSVIRRMKGKEEKVLDVKDLILIGKHNYENVMAAVAISWCMNVPKDIIVRVCCGFHPVEHRLEFVRERAGVKYYNDSKGTNPDASVKAIEAMPGPTILIAGGFDKKLNFDGWVESFGKKVKYIVLIGETRDQIAECCKKHGFTNIMYAESMEEAVPVAATYADVNYNVLLSPACASWDMFRNYEERGRIFKECVNKL